MITCCNNTFPISPSWFPPVRVFQSVLNRKKERPFREQRWKVLQCEITTAKQRVNNDHDVISPQSQNVTVWLQICGSHFLQWAKIIDASIYTQSFYAVIWCIVDYKNINCQNFINSNKMKISFEQTVIVQLLSSPVYDNSNPFCKDSMLHKSKVSKWYFPHTKLTNVASVIA